MKKFIRILIGCTVATILIWGIASVYNKIYYDMHPDYEIE